jgi:hypothetical protein
MVILNIERLNTADYIGICESSLDFNGYTETPKGRDNMRTEDITMATGENKTIRVFVKDKSLNVLNIAGATSYFTIKNSSDTSSVLLQKSTAIAGQGEIGVAANGEIIFYFTPDDTKDMSATQYVYDVLLVKADGKKYEVLKGKFTLEKMIYS